jgi:type I restriction enzyme R subunit
LNQLLAKFEEKDAALAAAKESSAALQAELEKVRAEVAAAQAAKAHQATQFDWDEASTRELFIDADLLGGRLGP